MSLITANALAMEYPGRMLFSGVSFSIEPKDHVGLIGANGAGKTTLFRLLQKTETPSEGMLTVASGLTIGTVEQHTCRDHTRTASQEMLSVFAHLQALEGEIDQLNRMLEQSGHASAELLRKQEEMTTRFHDGGGLTYRSRADAMLTGLGFTDAEKQLSVASLSGGQRTKIALGKLLLSDAQLILLDEPTNHLDVKSTRWLEDLLTRMNTAYIVISHDRYFLDRVTDKTMEIDAGHIYMTRGSYSAYMELKRQRIETQRREYEKKQKEIERIEGIIAQQKQFNQAHNYVTIASKQKQIDRIKADLIEPDRQAKKMRLRFESRFPSGNDVLFVSGLSKSFDDKSLFRDVSVNIYKGDRLFIIGENGCGKSTFLKTILGREKPDSGFVRFGANVQIGYFDQIQSGIDSSSSVIDDLYDTFPGMTISELRGYLGAFGFRGDDIYKLMRELSGGERARTELIKLMLRRPNLLILDEPTNHLDIRSRETLENALASYDGTILCVSHDRYLVDRLATRLLILENGAFREFEGTYSEYAATLDELRPTAKKQPAKTNDWLERKQRESADRKRKTRLARIETRLEEIGSVKEQLQSRMADPASAADYQKILELTEELNVLTVEEEELTEAWVRLSEE